MPPKYNLNILTGKFDQVEGSGSTEDRLITDASIITEITDGSNWNGSGDYTGSLTGLVEGNYYIDDTLKIKYFYDGTKLYRHGLNEIV